MMSLFLSETKANIEHRRFPLEKGLLIGVPNLLVTNEGRFITLELDCITLC